MCESALVFHMFPLEFSKHRSQRRTGLLKLKAKKEEEEGEKKVLSIIMQCLSVWVELQVQTLDLVLSKQCVELKNREWVGDWNEYATYLNVQMTERVG